MNETRDVAVIVGSLRKDSLNRKLANVLAQIAPGSLNLNEVEIGQLPIYNQDSDHAPPPVWTSFRERIRAADAILFVTPEHNRSVAAALERSSALRQAPSAGSVLTAICGSLWCF